MLFLKDQLVLTVPRFVLVFCILLICSSPSLAFVVPSRGVHQRVADTPTWVDDGKNWRITAGVAIERLPIIVRTLHPAEELMHEVQSKLEDFQTKVLPQEIFDLSQDQEKLKMQRDMGYQDENDGDEFVPAPRRTEADLKNDRKSINRRLDDRLYLIVKKNRDSNAWQFPQLANNDGETLREVG